MLTIGFNSTSYFLHESDGSVLLTVHVFEGMVGEGVDVHVRLTTLHGTANGTTVTLHYSSLLGGIIHLYLSL